MRRRKESNSRQKREQEAALRRMADEGLIRAADRDGPMPPLRWRPAKVAGKPLSQTMIEDREDGG